MTNCCGACENTLNLGTVQTTASVEMRVSVDKGGNMSVLIKGFEKPDHCLRCPVKGIDDECLLQSEAANADYESWEDQMANCPFIPVPPHGRLIDADALEDDDPNVCNSFMRDGYVESCEWGYSHEQIKSAPTIIPAEEGE